MKIVVLGGGISTEREVSLVSAGSVCRALRALGHRAVFVDLFLGIEEPELPLEQMFDIPDGRCGRSAIEKQAPDLKAAPLRVPPRRPGPLLLPPRASRSYRSPRTPGTLPRSIRRKSHRAFPSLSHPSGSFPRTCTRHMCILYPTFLKNKATGS